MGKVAFGSLSPAQGTIAERLFTYLSLSLSLSPPKANETPCWMTGTWPKDFLQEVTRKPRETKSATCDHEGKRGRACFLTEGTFRKFLFCKGGLKGQTDRDKHSQCFADFRFFFPGNYSISEAQIFAENRRKPLIFAENRRFSQKIRLSHLVCPL